MPEVVYYIVMYIAIVFILLIEHCLEISIWMQSMVMAGLAILGGKGGKGNKVMFVYDYGYIVLN